MKKLLIALGISIIVFNVIAGLIFSGYALYNNMLVNFSVFSSVLVTYLLYDKANADAFRIALTFGYSISGILKIILSIFSENLFEKNLLLLGIIGIIIIELLLLLLVQYMKKHV